MINALLYASLIVTACLILCYNYVIELTYKLMKYKVRLLVRNY